MFTPVESSLGAIFIQYATGSYMATEGKGVGYSSTLYGAATKPNVNNGSIVAGTLLSCAFVKKLLPAFIPEYPSSNSNKASDLGSTSNYCTSGFLIGLGSSLGHGCTSGHIICGVSRLRWRSIVATFVFTITAVITRAILDHNAPAEAVGEAVVSASSYDSNFTVFNENKTALLSLLAAGFANSYLLLPYLLKKIKAKHDETWTLVGRFLSGLSTGFQFGLGLIISGMASSSKVLGFLSIFNKDKFDPSLLAIPIFTILPNILTWSSTVPTNESELIEKKPVFENKYDLNFSNEITYPFLAGNAIFGVGWGMSGICPAPGLIGLFFNGRNGAYWILSFLAGQFTGKQIEAYQSKSKITTSSTKPKVN